MVVVVVACADRAEGGLGCKSWGVTTHHKIFTRLAFSLRCRSRLGADYDTHTILGRLASMAIAFALVAMGGGVATAVEQEVPGTNVTLSIQNFAGPVSWVWFTPILDEGGLQDFGTLQYSVTCVNTGSGEFCSGLLEYRGVEGWADCQMTDNVVTGDIVFIPGTMVEECDEISWSPPFSTTDPALVCGGSGSASGKDIHGQGGGYGMGSC